MRMIEEVEALAERLSRRRLSVLLDDRFLPTRRFWLVWLVLLSPLVERSFLIAKATSNMHQRRETYLVQLPSVLLVRLPPMKVPNSPIRSLAGAKMVL